jgi:hypothetical protein
MEAEAADLHSHHSAVAVAAAHHQGCSFLAKLNWHIMREDVVRINLLPLPVVILHLQEVVALPVH